MESFVAEGATKDKDDDDVRSSEDNDDEGSEARASVGLPTSESPSSEYAY